MAKRLLRPPGIESDIGEWQRQVSAAINYLVANVPSDSTAANVSDLKDDFNALLAVLRAISIK